MPTQCPGSQFAVRGRTGQIAPGGGKLRLRLSKPLAHVRGGGRAVASVKFFDETFLQKSFDLALALTGRQPGKKLGKQRSAFPGRRSASAVNSRPWQLAPLVLIKRPAHVRAGGCWKSPLRHAFGMTLSPAGSGDAAQWAAPITDRRGSGDQALNGAHWAPAPPQAFCKRAVTSQWDVAQQPTESADEKTENFMLLPL